MPDYDHLPLRSIEDRPVLQIMPLQLPFSFPRALERAAGDARDIWERYLGRRAGWRARAEATHEHAYLADLRSPRSSKRWQAAAGLGRNPLRSLEAISALVEALGDAEQFVRWQAAEALSGQEPGRVFTALTASLIDADPARRAGAAEALGKLGGEGAILALTERLDDGVPGVRMAACAALGQLADPTAATSLLPLLDDPEPDVVCSAARALGQIGNPAAATFLAQRLSQPGQPVLVRRALAAALVHAGHPDAQPQLLAALNDEDPQVRAYAADALGHVGTELAVAPLAGLKADKYRLIKGTVSDRAARAMELLERRGRREGSPKAVEEG